MHPVLKQDSELLYKTRILIGIVLVYAGILLVTCIYLLGFAPLLPSSAIASASLVGLLGCAYGGVLCILKRSDQYHLACNTVVFATLIAIAIGIGMSGGPVDSPATPVIVVPIIVAFTLNGRRSGLAWSQFVLLVHFALMVIHEYIYTFPQLLNANHMEVHHIYHWLITYVAIVGLMMVFDSINSLLKRERDEERDRFAYLAAHDPLTNLANRSMFEEQLVNAMSRADRSGDLVGLFFIDLDGFKPINDQLGHDAGDLVLKVISQRLLEGRREHDLVARIGGDEFAVILEGLKSPGHCEQLATQLLTCISQNIDELDADMNVSGSLGISLYPIHTNNKDKLIKHADTAMYEAKREKNRWCLYEPSLEVA